MKRILDPAFRYRPSFDTDLKETFSRVRLEQRAAPAPVPLDKEKPNVVRLKRGATERR